MPGPAHPASTFEKKHALSFGVLEPTPGAFASFSTIAGLAIPPLIGNLAQATSTRHALLLVIFASLTSFTLAKAVRRDERLFARLRRRLGGRRGDPIAEAIAIAPSDTGTTLG